MKKNGFTLIEAVVTIVIFTIISGTVFSFITALYRAQDLLFIQSDVLEEARRGMSQIVREIREADSGDDGSYMISKADNYEIIFHADLTGDGITERVRYYINPAGGRTGLETQTCTSFQAGGSCQVTFSGFLKNKIKSATLSVSVEGDLDHPREYANIISEGVALGTLCSGGGTCGQCFGAYQDLRSFDVTGMAVDNVLSVTVSASSRVDPICQWEDPNHSVKAQFVLSWEEEPLPQQSDLLIKEVVQIKGWPPSYDGGATETILISRDVRNKIRQEPVFLYYDKMGRLINNPSVQIKDINMVKIKIILNPNPGRPPDDFSLVSAVQLRNYNPYED